MADSHLPSRRSLVASAVREEESYRPLTSLLASAVRIAGTRVRRIRHEKWQDEAWNLFGQLGEVRAPAIQFGNAVSRAPFFVARQLSDPTEVPEPLEEGPAYDVFTALGTTPLGRAQLVRRIAEQIWVGGESYLVGVIPLDSQGEVPLTDLRWEVVSGDEIESLQEGRAGGQRDAVLVDEDGNPLTTARLTVRIWRPHARRWWEADSAVRSSLPVLRELVGLTKYVSAQIDSRLAGAGILAVTQNATVITGTEESEVSLIDALVEAMIRPIEDRDHASSFVPLLLQVIGDDASKAMHWYNFFTELDKQARELRDEAIRRWALGADLPPELLLGMSEGNHWTSWLIREETVTTHLEPMLALIADALTTQYLWPILEEMDVPDAREFVIWYDPSPLTRRPNRVEQATDLYDRGELSGDALRREAGFNEADAPLVGQPRERALETAMEMISSAPTLAVSPGLTVLIDELTDVFSELERGAPSPQEPSEPRSQPDEVNIPDTLPEERPGETDGTPEGVPASAHTAHNGQHGRVR